MAFLSPMRALRDSVPFLAWLPTSSFVAREKDPNIANFMFGNPHEMPLADYVAALAKEIVPQDKDWFAYKLNESVATETVAASLRSHTGLSFEARDVVMTTGGFAAIASTLRAIVSPGDEVVYLSPPWFFYELLIRATGGVPVKVPLSPPQFSPDPDRIAQAIGPKTRAVLINTPHNPSGRVFTDQELKAFGEVVEQASRKHGREIFVLSDEAYRKIVFDGRRAPSPAEHYARTIVLYSYGKQLLAPGQRIGYAAFSPRMSDTERAELGEAMMYAQCAGGFTFPNAVLQYALPAIENLSIDLRALERRRDRVVSELARSGYEVVRPEGTFYTLARLSGVDEDRLLAELAKRDTFVLPGRLVELPGWVRISLTAHDGMIERGLAAFAEVAKRPA